MARTASQDARIGTELAGFRIEALLGRGGMSVVYLAEDLRLGRKVALKLLGAELAEDERFRERFLRESRRAASLDHQNVVPIYEAGEADGLLYIAMRYVKGMDLGALLRQSRLEPAKGLAIVAQVGEALDAAHARGLVHRDVKPGNVLIAPDEHAYLTDFGLTKGIADERTLTETGQLLGTLDYVAPEQIEGGPVNACADVYSLGCVLYECLVGEAPYRRERPLAVLWAHLNERPPAASERNPGLPVGVDPVIRRALAKEPSERFPSCRELVAAAQAALAERVSLDPARRASRMEFRILGPIEVLGAGRRLSLGGARQRALLALLLVRANEVVSKDRLIEALWGGEAPGTAGKPLQAAVSRLRKRLGAERIVTCPSGYLLQVEPEELDRARFERLLRAGRKALARGEAEAAAATLAEALSLWRGAALADVLYEPFAQGEIARLEELRLGCLEDRIEADLACGRHSEAVGELEALVESHPLRERLRAQLMVALYRSGRQVEALAAYRKIRETLVEELGIEPGPALKELEQAILRHDETLAGPARLIAPPQPEPGPETASVREELRPVTVLCADLEALTGSSRRLDAETARAVLPEPLSAIAAILARHGGSVQRLPGDRLIGVFGLPALHEDDVLRAARAAIEAREEVAGRAAALKDRDVLLGVRMGLATSEVIAAGTELVAGDVVALAARLSESADSWEICVAEETRRLGADALEVEAAAPGAPGARLLAVAPDGELVARALERPLVGRGAELDRLRGAFERARAARIPELVTVVGGPGIGKSRLALELVRGLAGDATVLRGRCLPYGEGITYWPLRELVRDAAGAEGEEALRSLLTGEPEADLVTARIAQAVGAAGGSAESEEIAWAARKLLEALARSRPLLLVLEDLHWAEPVFLELLEHILDRAADAPVLLLCLARPELLEERSSWGAGRRNASLLWLEPLSEQECDALLGILADERTLPAGLRAQALEVAEGNPLYLEQLAAFLAEEQPRPDRRGAPVPPTIHALLAARLERLGPGERAVVEAAAVIGRQFWLGSVVALLPEEARASVPRHLDALVRRELIRPDRSQLPGEEGFRFRHILIQTVAYRAIPRARRPGLHERFVAWVEARPDAGDYEEILGYHLEQAWRCRAELGIADPALAANAAARLGSAGRKALARGDLPAAINLFERAVSVLPAEEPTRAMLLPPLGVALTEVGRFAEAGQVLDEAVIRAHAVEDESLEAHALLDRISLRLQVETDEAIQDARRLDGSLLDVFERHGDDLGLCRLWRLRGLVRWFECRAAEAEEAWALAADYARRAEATHELAEILCWRVSAAYRGPTPVAEAVRRCEEMCRELRGQRSDAAWVLQPLAALHAMAGRFETAHDLLARSRAVLEEFGAAVRDTLAEFEAFVLMLAGEPARAEERLRASHAALEEMGERALLSGVAVQLAQALCAQARYDEAYPFTELGEAASGRHDIWAQIGWRAARAKILARRERLEEAEALAREAVRLAEGTDRLSDHGDALLDLAEVLRGAGRDEEAGEAARRALHLYELKGNVVSAEKARELARLALA